MKDKTTTYIGAVIIVLLLITATIALVSNSKNKRNLKAEKSQTEALTSQKLQVSQELDKVRNDLASVTAKDETTEKNLKETESKLADNEKRIHALSRENSSLMNDKKELGELKKSKEDLDKAYADLKLEQQNSLSRIKDLENSQLDLQSDKKELALELQNSETYRTDDIEIYGSRGKNDKITVCAHRTKKINLNFEVPESLTEAISFNIVTPSGNIIKPEDKALTWYIAPDARNMTASLSDIGQVFEKSRKVTLSYSAKEKLAPGEYKIQIFSKDKDIGNCRLKLK